MGGKLLILSSLQYIQEKKIGGILYLLAFLASLFVVTTAMARDEYPGRVLTRGEVVDRIVDAFDLGQREKSFIGACKEHPDDCFFVFSAMSDYDDIVFEPFLKLYPDVNEKFRYYEAINTASMLGLVHGYLNEEATPFKPEVPMTRIQALKITLGAANLIPWKERFELSEADVAVSTPYVDTILSTPEGWWYNRYLNFAYEENIISGSDLFRPDKPITFEELQEMINNTLAYSEARRHDSKTAARGDSTEQTDA